LPPTNRAALVRPRPPRAHCCIVEPPAGTADRRQRLDARSLHFTLQSIQWFVFDARRFQPVAA
ncbi:MAG: hypothetical protein ACRC1K_00080, partial [Planctomycetia bacterium]